MAPQTDYEEGTSFYGAVEIAPKLEERMTNRSKTLKLLVGLAFIAVALTAAVFAFTSPVATRSVESVDIEAGEPHYVQQTCICKSNCVNEPGYGNEGICEVTWAAGDGDGCKDFLGQDDTTCTPEQATLLLFPDEEDGSSKRCGSCDIIVGENSCFQNPCQHGGLCADRAKDVTTKKNSPNRQGYYCHCPFGWTGATCSAKMNFCGDANTARSFCDNGKYDHVCTEAGNECEFVYKENTDEPSTCTAMGQPVCHMNAICTSLESLEVIDSRTYTCSCNAGYDGDGYQADQEHVAFGSILEFNNSCPKVRDGEDGALVAPTPEPSYGWLKRPCPNGVGSTYAGPGCRNINGCTQQPGGGASPPTGACGNGASCNDTYSRTNVAMSYECICPVVKRGGNMVAVWKGTQCMEEINECTESLCGNNAGCTDLSPASSLDDPRNIHGYKCTCDDSWVSYPDGYDDDTNLFLGCKDEDDCRDDPCKNGATCANDGLGTGSYLCTCADGWSGVTCELDTKECRNNNEDKGTGHTFCKAEGMTCIEENAVNGHTRANLTGNAQGWKCGCNDYYTWDRDWTAPELLSGQHGNNSCVDVLDCDAPNEPCGNGATCAEKGESIAIDYTCTCVSGGGWKGDNCDEDIDECSFVSTRSGTIETDEYGNTVLNTAEGGEDRLHNCREDAQCLNEPAGSWTCKCLDGFYGNGIDFCHEIDDCARYKTATHFCTTDMQECAGENDLSCGGVCQVDGQLTITRCNEDSDCKDNLELRNIFSTDFLAANSTCITANQECTADVDLTRDAYPRGYAQTQTADGVLSITATYTPATKFISPAEWVLEKRVYAKSVTDDVHQCGKISQDNTWIPTGVCVDTGVNSFRCDCDDGWTDSNCDVDVAECQLGIDDCDRNAKCTETDGSFLCKCQVGYEDGHTDCRSANATDYAAFTHEQKSLCGLSCSDIDDCILSGGCVNGVCRDLGANAFKCKCSVGYTDFLCDADINECGLMTDDCDHQDAECFNLPGSWECKCKDGYVGTGKVGGCTEINDCAQSPCEHGDCEDLGNSYKCTCENGWGDKHCDHDKNECLLESNLVHNCHAQGKCVNTPGSYYCRCVSGFQGDGYTCMDLDDCDPDPCGNEQLEKVSCKTDGVENPTGLYTCALSSTLNAFSGIAADKLRCKDLGANSYQCNVCPGYEGGISPSDINECVANTDLCSSNAACTNTEGSYKCTCASNHYDPCKCEEDAGTLSVCRTCKRVGTGELCIPGRECVECTNCKTGTDDSSSRYACPNDANLNPNRWYFPADPQFNGGTPTNPGRSTGKGFEEKEGSTCIHTDVECVNINECDQDRHLIQTYNGITTGCPEAAYADCIDECGTVRCECTGLVNGCTKEEQCYFGPGNTCSECQVCEVNECETDAPTSTSDRRCVSLIPDGIYAIETTSGHTAQCLVMWEEPQKVFPERYNWGGHSAGEKVGGMDVADLCVNPICGVCEYDGKTAKENIITGQAAVWTFRHLSGEEYLIMSAVKGGLRCLGFRANGAPYPELIRWETQSDVDSTGTCDIGTCSGSGNRCWDRNGCDGTETCNLITGCITLADCGSISACSAAVPEHAGALCIPNAATVNSTQLRTGKTKTGDACECSDAPTPSATLNCAHGHGTSGMWVNDNAVAYDGNAEDYNCGMESKALVQNEAAVVWRIVPLGHQSESNAKCYSKKKCSLAKYENLFVIESKSNGAGTKYECLRFKDGDFSSEANPTLVKLKEPGFSNAQNMCNIDTSGTKSVEESLVAQKGSVWKLIPLQD